MLSTYCLIFLTFSYFVPKGAIKQVIIVQIEVIVRIVHWRRSSRRSRRRRQISRSSSSSSKRQTRSTLRGVRPRRWWSRRWGSRRRWSRRRGSRRRKSRRWCGRRRWGRRWWDRRTVSPSSPAPLHILSFSPRSSSFFLASFLPSAPHILQQTITESRIIIGNPRTDAGLKINNRTFVNFFFLKN